MAPPPPFRNRTISRGTILAPSHHLGNPPPARGSRLSSATRVSSLKVLVNTFTFWKGGAPYRQESPPAALLSPGHCLPRVFRNSSPCLWLPEHGGFCSVGMRQFGMVANLRPGGGHSVMADGVGHRAMWLCHISVGSREDHIQGLIQVLMRGLILIQGLLSPEGLFRLQFANVLNHQQAVQENWSQALPTKGPGSMVVFVLTTPPSPPPLLSPLPQQQHKVPRGNRPPSGRHAAEADLHPGMSFDIFFFPQ